MNYVSHFFVYIFMRFLNVVKFFILVSKRQLVVVMLKLENREFLVLIIGLVMQFMAFCMLK